MIYNLEQLRHSLFEKIKLFYNLNNPEDLKRAKSLSMTSPGISSEEEKRIHERFPHLPESYLKVVREYVVKGITIGYLNASPGFQDDQTLEKELITSNTAEYFTNDFMQKHDFIIIGGEDEDVRCVAGTESKTFIPGEIVLIRDAFYSNTPEDDQLHPMAKDFEQFLILAGNVNLLRRQLSKQEGSSANDFIKEFTKVLEELKVNKKYWGNLIGPRMVMG